MLQVKEVFATQQALQLAEENLSTKLLKLVKTVPKTGFLYWLFISSKLLFLVLL